MASVSTKAEGASETLDRQSAAPAPGRMAGERVVVTGASGGVGSAIMRRFADEGALVRGLDVAVDRDAQSSVVLACDIADDTSVAASAQDLQADFGAASIVVHAAAATENAKTVEASSEAFAHIYNVNVIGAVRLARAFAPAMIDAGRGSFVFISSINGAMGAPGLAAYSASKGALDALTKTLALELAPHGVRVNAVAPASVDTPMLRDKLANHDDPEAAFTANRKRHLLERWGEPEEVAALTAFLASREAAWITGGIHLIDGGAHLARR